MVKSKSAIKDFIFCEKLVDCFSYNHCDIKNKFAEVEILGYTNTGDGKEISTNHLKITKEILFDEVSKIVNMGDLNSGYGNIGDKNAVHRNANYRNIGDENQGDGNTGVFCTRTRNRPIQFFNKNSYLTWKDWFYHPARDVADRIKLTERVQYEDMTENEKIFYPHALVNGEYLKVYTYHDAWTNLWKTLTNIEKKFFKQLPNYDPDIFDKITGIKNK